MNKRYRSISNSKKRGFNFTIQFIKKSENNVFSWLIRGCSLLVILQPFFFEGNSYVKNILLVYEIFSWVIILPLGILVAVILAVNFKDENTINAKNAIAKKFLEKRSLVSKLFGIIGILAIIVTAAIGNLSLCIVLILISLTYVHSKSQAKSIVKEME